MENYNEISKGHMKTVAEVARIFEVAPQTIYRKLNGVKDVAQGESPGLTVKQGAITYITEDGEKFLAGCLTPPKESVKPSETASHHVEQGVKQGDTALNAAKQDEVKFLREQVKSLQAELSAERQHSRAMNERVAGMADNLAHITENQQKLLLTEQAKTAPALMGGKEAQRKGKPAILGLFRRK